VTRAARVALVTASAAVHLDEDLPPLVAALEAAGVDPAVVVWDDATVPWASFDLAVVRSTWDYVPRRDEFLAWAEATAEVVPLVNPPAVLRWNTDKRYLQDLADAGVPVVPTSFVQPGGELHVPEGEVVVKPVIGAGSMDTERYQHERQAEAIAHARRLLDDGRAVMVQPYLAAVDDEGETALVYIDGVFSHAIRKGPILRTDGTVFVEGLYAEEHIEPRQPSDEELAVARLALEAVPGDSAPLYARVDVVPGPDTAPVVLEMELAEPSLFFAYEPESATRFASAVTYLVARSSGHIWERGGVGFDS
jgi:glutathione synthase/RimK-type ligase-like ATP-grasp enzyme